MLKVLLCVGGFSFLSAASIIDDVDNIRIDRILKLNLPEESFKEDFFKIQVSKFHIASETNDLDSFKIS